MNGKLPLLTEKPVTFGVISDVHQDIAHDAPERLTAFLKEAERRQVDFIIELGDFCFAKEENRSYQQYIFGTDNHKTICSIF